MRIAPIVSRASALVTAEPAAFVLHRAELRRLVESLRAAPYSGPDYTPPTKS